MGEISKISGVSEDNIAKVLTVSTDDIAKVSGESYPAASQIASRWIIGAGAGLLLSASNPEQANSGDPGATGWGTMVDLGGMNIKAIAYGEDSLGNKRWVIGTTSTSHEIAYCDDDPDALAKNFSDPTTPRWQAIDLDPSLKAANGGPNIAFTSTGGAGGSDRVWVGGGLQLGSTPGAQSIKRSTDGAENWTILASGSNPGQQQPTRAVCYKSGREWYAINDSDIWKSTDDGATWGGGEPHPGAPSTMYPLIEDPGGLTGVFNAMAYNPDDGSNGRWVVVGNSGAIGYSTDNWGTGNEATDSGSGGPFGTNHIYGVVYCAGIVNKWVACSAGGKIGYSTDGNTWTAATTGSPGAGGSDHFRSIATDNTTIVAVGQTGIIYTSTNGTSFTQRGSGVSQTLWSVACDVIGAGMR